MGSLLAPVVFGSLSLNEFGNLPGGAKAVGMLCSRLVTTGTWGKLWRTWGNKVVSYDMLRGSSPGSGQTLPLQKLSRLSAPLRNGCGS